jgi:aubergine-like protein
MITNYFRLTRGPQWKLHEYHVFCEPTVDKVPVKKAMLRKNQESLGAYIFDGTKMYTAHVIDDNKLVFDVEMTEGIHKVTLRHVGEIEPGNPTYIQFYNIILRRCLFGMGLEEMGRHFYDHTAAIDLQQQRLSLWPGKLI